MSCTTSPFRLLATLLLAASVSATAKADTVIKTENIQREAVASDLVELAWSDKQQAIFVTSPDWKDEKRSTVLRLDPQTLAVKATIPLEVKGFGVALDDAGNRLYLTEGFNGAVGVVDTASNQHLATIKLQKEENIESAWRKAGMQGEHLDFMLAELKRFKITDGYLYKVREARFDAQTGRLFLPGLGYGVDSVLFVVNTRTQKLEKIIPGFGFYAVGIAIDEKGRRVFVSNMQGQLMTVNADTLALTAKHEIQADQLLNLVYDPQGNRVLGVDQGIDRDKYRNYHLKETYNRRSSGHRLFALNADDGKLLASVETDEIPIGLLLDEQNQRVFVTNRNGVRVDKGDGTLSVFDAKTLQHLQTLPLPPHPNSLTLDAKSNTLFVTVKNDGESKKAGKAESIVRIQQ
ncbi:YncE family protein [Phytobacter sp. V91]|uniref:YncE family protein n=1 Tax=Phytobacter sp. V91 TaxID=3369425 RepID=UPI003F61D138